MKNLCLLVSKLIFHVYLCMCFIINIKIVQEVAQTVNRFLWEKLLSGTVAFNISPHCKLRASLTILKYMTIEHIGMLMQVTHCSPRFYGPCIQIID